MAMGEASLSKADRHTARVKKAVEEIVRGVGQDERLRHAREPLNVTRQRLGGRLGGVWEMRWVVPKTFGPKDRRPAVHRQQNLGYRTLAESSSSPHPPSRKIGTLSWMCRNTGCGPRPVGAKNIS